MPRRSWRDLDRPDPPAAVAREPDAPPAAAPASGDLERAAHLVPDSRLGALIAERRTLEDRLRNLTGLPGQQSSGDAARDARFAVPSFAERQAEQREWEAQRQARMQRQTQNTWGNADRWTRAASDGDAETRALPTPTTALGATGLTERMRDLRRSAVGRSRDARERLLRPSRAVTAQIDELGRPVGDMADQLADQQRGLEELDRKLAAEGVDASERREIRDAVGADTIDKVSGVLNRASKAIDAPKKAVAKIEDFWARKEQQISGAMDRSSAYATDRDRRLSTETGGSGDLFQRMQNNRMSALRRRRDAKFQERRDAQRRERARERATQRRAEGGDL